MYKGAKIAMNENFYNILNSLIPVNDITNIGLVFNSQDKLYYGNFYNKDSHSFDLSINEEFSIDGSRFYIIKDGETYTIPKIVNNLTEINLEIGTPGESDNVLYYKSGSGDSAKYYKTSFIVNGSIISINDPSTDGMLMEAGRKNYTNGYIAPFISDTYSNLLISKSLEENVGGTVSNFIKLTLKY